MNHILFCAGAATILLFASCATPRQVLLSPYVTPDGQFTGGVAGGYQTSSIVLKELNHSAITRFENLLDDDDTTSLADSATSDVSKMIAAQGIDPLGPYTNMYIAYGLLPRTEVGYQYLGSGHGVWIRSQLFGGQPRELSGSMGFYASTQNYDLPFYLSDIQDALGYDIERTDFTLPFSLGNRYKWNLISLEWGSVMQIQRSHIRYEFSPTRVYRVIADNGGSAVLNAVPQSSVWHWSGGGSVNGRFGIGPVFLGAGFGYYYADYQTYKLPDNRKVHFTGGALAVHYVIEVRIW